MEIIILTIVLTLVLLAIGVWAGRRLQEMDASTAALKEQIEQADEAMAAIKAKQADLSRQEGRYFTHPAVWQVWEYDGQVEAVIVESLS